MKETCMIHCLLSPVQITMPGPYVIPPVRFGYFYVSGQNEYKTNNFRVQPAEIAAMKIAETPQRRELVNTLIQELIHAGWELNSMGSYWYSYGFQRDTSSLDKSMMPRNSNGNQAFLTGGQYERTTLNNTLRPATPINKAPSPSKADEVNKGNPGKTLLKVTGAVLLGLGAAWLASREQQVKPSDSDSADE